MSIYHVTCPMTKEPIYFGSINDLRAFVLESTRKNKSCNKTIHVWQGRTVIATMRRTPEGVKYRPKSKPRDHTVLPNGRLED